jgi:hypothetical protein
MAESFCLGVLDPQQAAIWRQMTPAQKIRPAFQLGVTKSGWGVGATFMVARIGQVQDLPLR